MVNLLALVFMSSLTVWRITSILYGEQMFDWLRRWIGIDQITDDWETWLYPAGIVGEIWSCFWCLSLIVAAIVALLALTFYPMRVGEWIILWLGGSAGAILFDRWTLRSKARS